MKTRHEVKVVQNPQQLEIVLDNAVNQRWTIVAIVPHVLNGETSGYTAVFSKGEIR